MCIAFLFSIKFLEIFEISQKLKSFSSFHARGNIFPFRCYVSFDFSTNSIWEKWRLTIHLPTNLKCFSKHFFLLSARRYDIHAFESRSPIFTNSYSRRCETHHLGRFFSKIDEFVLFFRKRQPSKNMEERSVKIKLSFLTPLCGHTHTFLRIPLSKNLENSHGSALLWFRSPLLKPEKIPPPSLTPSISPFPRDSFGEKNKKKERREREQAVVVISSCSTGKPLHSNEDPIVKNDRLFVPPSLSLFCIDFVPSRGT